jgi:type I restriction-modification system DNA methylase subunit
VTKEEGREIVRQLVELFDSRKTQIMKQDYLETSVRTEFLDDFFKALGWDIKNRTHLGEVRLESGLKPRTDGKKGRADYEFNLGRGKSFFVEAKKPFEKLETNAHHAVQARRYAFSAKHPVVILSDFEEFSVYPGRGVEPKAGDGAEVARLDGISCKYMDYMAKWDQIWRYFSRDSVRAGALETIPGITGDAKGERTVDELFLTDIETWRKDLAENIYKNNPQLSPRSLNEVVQKTIDRIVFLRICEDREIENYGRIQKLKGNDEIYRDLCRLFQKADQRYNAGLFNFDKGSGDNYLTLNIDNEPLQKIIERLYFPGGPYAFAVMPADILGQVYERFLGKVIEIGVDGVKVEDKPSVKKAGGVFYTPEYIVDYIVKNTASAFCWRGKNSRDVDKLKILDPACGSGAFLICAYQYLLDWYLHYYTHVENPEKWQKKRRLIKDIDGVWRLSLSERKRILINNIFGVDIDAQAVEVTRLSLLLKCLEGETMHSTQLGLFDANDRVLPDLSGNIKCGNSLIGTDFDLSQQMLLPIKEMEDAFEKINPFDWKSEFQSVFDQGGFDVLIGNPPYVRQETLGAKFKEYVKARFSAFFGTADLYVYFIEQAHRLLKEGGLFGYICSNKFMRANYGKPLRSFLSQNVTIRQVVDFGELPVFSNAATFPLIILTENKKPVSSQSFVYAPIKRLDFDSLEEEVRTVGQTLDDAALKGGNWTLSGTGELAIFEKMKNIGMPLGDYVGGKIFYGIKTGFNQAFVIDRETRDQLIAEDPKCAPLIKRFAIGDYIRKYRIEGKEKFVIVIPRGWTHAQLEATNQDEAWLWFQMSYPSLAAHLAPFAQKCAKRYDKGDFWWELRTCDYYDAFEKPKIIYPDIAKESRATFDADGVIVGNTAYIIPIKDLYLLGILNSKLVFAYYKRIASVLGDADKGGRLRWFTQDVIKIPIRLIDPDNSADVAKRDEIVRLVETLLKLHQAMATASNKDLFRRQIESADRRIDALVYGLYGIDEADIRLIEGI